MWLTFSFCWVLIKVGMFIFVSLVQNFCELFYFYIMSRHILVWNTISWFLWRMWYLKHLVDDLSCFTLSLCDIIYHSMPLPLHYCMLIHIYCVWYMYFHYICNCLTWNRPKLWLQFVKIWPFILIHFMWILNGKKYRVSYYIFTLHFFPFHTYSDTESSDFSKDV